jgi:hypothetical protein
MKRAIALAVVVTALISSCIDQEESTGEWTIEEWKDHLFFASPTMDQSITNMAAGLGNIEELAPGTHIVFDGGGRGTSLGFQGAPIASYGMTVEITVLEDEVVNGEACTVAEVKMEMRTNVEGQPVSIVITGKQWTDAAGTPVKVDAEAKMELLEGFETSLKSNLEFVGEEQYKGHDCWVFSGTQSTELMGISLDNEVEQYMDKKSKAVVGTLIDGVEQQMGKEYVDAAIFVSELEWKLGKRETITTELGTYDCQVIYLKKDGKKFGTVWAHEEFRTPLKYVITYEVEDMNLEMTMTLIEYSLGT